MLVLCGCDARFCAAYSNFFGISFIDEYSYNLENEVKQLERGLAEKNFMLQIYDGMRIGQTLLDFCNRNIDKRKISIQLMIIAEILLKHEDKIVTGNK